MDVWKQISLLFLLAAGHLLSKVSPLAEQPDWSKLDEFQGKWDKDDFFLLLTKVYCPRDEWWQPWIKAEENKVLIRKRNGFDEWFVLRCREKQGDERRDEKKKTRAIKTIVLDPGHIGGDFSEMEGRHFQIGEARAVKEGDISLAVAQRLKVLLEENGFEVFLVRDSLQPVTVQRSSDFEKHAESWVRNKFGEKQDIDNFQELKKKRSEIMFYRISEIHARAQKINQSILPDLAFCLHLNAAPWKDEEKKELVDRNDYHVLVNGCYMGGELAFDDQRFEMVFRLLNSWHETESELAENLCHAFAEQTGLPAFSYKGPNALKIGEVPGVWARNLLANRIYNCPVLFLEPYIANSKTEYQRIQMGNYRGKKAFDGQSRLSVVEEYAQSVLSGILKSVERK